MKWNICLLFFALLHVFSFGIVNAEDSLWTDIKPGENKLNLSLNKDGSVNYFGEKIAKFTRFEAIKVSPQSKKNGYITVIAWDYDKAGTDLFLLDSKTKKIIVKTNHSKGLLPCYGEWISWSPNESYASVAHGGEGIVEVAVIYIKIGLIKGVNFENLSKNYKGNIKEMQVVDYKNASWKTDTKFTIPINILCNPYDDNECTGDTRTGELKPRRIYEATIDLTNINNVIYTTIKK